VKESLKTVLNVCSTTASVGHAAVATVVLVATLSLSIHSIDKSRTIMSEVMHANSVEEKEWHLEQLRTQSRPVRLMEYRIVRMISSFKVSFFCSMHNVCSIRAS